MPTKNLIRALAIALMGASLFSGCKFLNPATTTAEGVYFGFYTANDGSNPVAIYGAILPKQYAYFGDANGDLYILPNDITNGSFSGSVTAWPPFGETFSNGDSQRSFNLSGQANASNNVVTDITGILSGATGGGSFTLTHNDLSTPAPSLANLAGTYQGYYWGISTAISLTLNADGSFTLNDAFGCSGSGTLSVTSGYNLLQLNATLTGNSVCAGTVSGLGFTDTKDLNDLFNNGSGTYIYLGASNSNTGFVAELYKS
ncbi:MAG: hypothetical protein WCB49_02040 [Gammaproteobacteria bacterium]